MRVDLPRNPDWEMPAIVTASKGGHDRYYVPREIRLRRALPGFCAD